jgi:maltose O-acetyltransferase
LWHRIRHWLSEKLVPPRAPEALAPLRRLVAEGGRIVYLGSPPMLGVAVRMDGMGVVTFGDGVTLGYPPAPRIGDGEILLQARRAEATISVGRGTYISNNTSIIAISSIRIGEACLVGNSVLIVDNDFHHLAPDRRRDPNPPSKPVTIGDNVWIGSSVIILKGVAIGDNSVIGAGAVVTKDVAANHVAAGNPATIIRSL